jgi:hypothetical protein
MSDTIDTAKAASELGTDARQLRKFLRSDASPLQPVGQGARYVITPADIPELKAKFDAWKTGRRSSTPSTTPRVARTRTAKAREILREDPLEQDDVMVRTTSSIGDRQRRHGIVCNHSWNHPKVRGLPVKCTNPSVAGTRYCKHHPQITWCGDEEPVPMICGPSPELANSPTGHPYCKYHNGDIDEEEFNKLLLDNPNADLLE